ncbi:uncharacterized protein LOC123705893 [Colias croceus]|uniref:uncharacterized protein LOC119829459 n=1 Tax=Zerene cesonia TaxID=33412 RepID=UPI0018E50632|nr:uncharacterized protein LOC119829459 [Zerene cesonia]XP_045510935.1 uncharacterized protein LOC123705893 [Colias croceus]CAG4944839.1 unnamed protein product [Colias eurytheme]
METKGSQNVSGTNLANIPMSEDGVVYIAVKGSLHANDCSVFGLGQEEIKALTKKYPGSGDVVNGVTMKTNVLQLINSLSQLGYKIVASTGEAEITWTLGRDI